MLEAISVEAALKKQRREYDEAREAARQRALERALIKSRARGWRGRHRGEPIAGMIARLAGPGGAVAAPGGANVAGGVAGGRP